MAARWWGGCVWVLDAVLACHEGRGMELGFGVWGWDWWGRCWCWLSRYWAWWGKEFGGEHEWMDERGCEREEGLGSWELGVRNDVVVRS